MTKPTGPVIITVCTSCREAGVDRADAPGRRLHDAVARAAGDGVVVRPTQCLSVCKRVCTVSLSAEGGYTFLFGDLDPDGMLTRLPRGFAGDHPVAPWLRYQSFTLGRELTASEVTSARLPHTLARHFMALTPFVRWLNAALGLASASRR